MKKLTKKEIEVIELINRGHVGYKAYLHVFPNANPKSSRSRASELVKKYKQQNLILASETLSLASDFKKSISDELSAKDKKKKKKLFLKNVDLLVKENSFDDLQNSFPLIEQKKLFLSQLNKAITQQMTATKNEDGSELGYIPDKMLRYNFINNDGEAIDVAERQIIHTPKDIMGMIAEYHRVFEGDNITGNSSVSLENTNTGEVAHRIEINLIKRTTAEWDALPEDEKKK